MSYSGNPADSPLDEVRHKVGDTDSTHEFLSNEEIEWELGQAGGDVDGAAANAAERIAARVFPQVDYRMHGVWVSGSQVSKNLREIAAYLRVSRGLAGAGPFVSGVTSAQKESEEANTSVRPKSFRVGMHDAPGVVEV